MIEQLASSPWWVLLLAGIGVLAISATTLNLFSAIGDRPGAGSVTKHCTVDSEDFLLGLSGTLNSPLQRGGSARILNNGDAFVPAIEEAIGEARTSVNFMTYIWQPGQMSDRFFDLLTRKAAEGVPVRVMVDGLGAIRARSERVAELREAGGKWVWFNPPRFGKLTRIYKRNHRRAIVVDGRIGFTGGMAVGDKWLGDAEGPDHWRDSMVEVRGCIATSLQSAFAQLWSDQTGEVLVGPAYFPPGQREGDGPGESISQHLSVITSPSVLTHPLRNVFRLSISSAQRTVYITNPYFVPDDIIAAALQERARSGVDVRVLVPNEHIDIPLIRWASHAYYERFLRSGMRLYEYQPTMIHQKTMVVDGLWSVVGSANMDVRSKELNQENVLGILDDGFARELEETFFADLERAREILLDEWVRRPAWRRIPERVSQLFEEQF